MEKLEPLCTVDGRINGTDDMENSMVVLPKLKIQLPYDPTILLLGIIEISLPVKNVGTHVHCNIILSSQDVET